MMWFTIDDNSNDEIKTKAYNNINYYQQTSSLSELSTVTFLWHPDSVVFNGVN